MYKILIIYKSRSNSHLSNVYYSSIILHFWPELDHHLCFDSPINAMQKYCPINCTGCTYTAGTTFSCQDDLSSIFCARKCVLVIIQNSIFGRITMTILWLTHIGTIWISIALSLASNLVILWFARTPISWKTMHFFMCAIFVTPRPILQFHPEFNHYPLLHSHRYNWNKYRFIIGIESCDTVICTYSSQPDNHIFLHVRDICYSSSNTSILSRVQPLSFTLII